MLKPFLSEIASKYDGCGIQILEQSELENQIFSFSKTLKTCSGMSATLPGTSLIFPIPLKKASNVKSIGDNPGSVADA